MENLDNSVKRNYVDVVAANAIDTEAVNLLALLKNHVRDSYDKSVCSLSLSLSFIYGF